jgi:DNA-binding NarL/FixJ family response regulator
MTPATTQKPEDPPAVRPRVVVADDDEIVRTVLTAQLAEDFECVGAAADATQAIALVTALNPDVVILDVNMPGGGAIQATREIRARAPRTAIVILSIDETWSDLIDLLNAGAMTYLRKGIDEATITHDLHAAIRAHSEPVQSRLQIVDEVKESGPLAPPTSALVGLLAAESRDKRPRVWTSGHVDEQTDAA